MQLITVFDMASGLDGKGSGEDRKFSKTWNAPKRSLAILVGWILRFK